MEERWRKLCIDGEKWRGYVEGDMEKNVQSFRTKKYEKMSCFGVTLSYKTTILTIKEGR